MQEVLCETDNYNKPSFLPRSEIVNGKCNSELPMESLFPLMSSQFRKGFTIMAVDYKRKRTFHEASVIPTDFGQCATVFPQLIGDPKYFGPSRWNSLRNIKPGVMGGKSDGIEILFDTEAYDQGVVSSLAYGAIFQVE